MNCAVRPSADLFLDDVLVYPVLCPPVAIVACEDGPRIQRFLNYAVSSRATSHPEL